MNFPVRTNQRRIEEKIRANFEEFLLLKKFVYRVHIR